jgi:hypothetical protein
LPRVSGPRSLRSSWSRDTSPNTSPSLLVSVGKDRSSAHSFRTGHQPGRSATGRFRLSNRPMGGTRLKICTTNDGHPAAPDCSMAMTLATAAVQTVATVRLERERVATGPILGGCLRRYAWARTPAWANGLP